MTGFAMMATINLEYDDMCKAANAAFDERIATLPADIRAKMTPEHEAALRFMFVNGWKAGIFWFGEEASKQAEDMLARALTESCTGGNA